MVCFTFLVIIRRCPGDRDINAILRSPGRTGDTQEESKPEERGGKKKPMKAYHLGFNSLQIQKKGGGEFEVEKVSQDETFLKLIQFCPIGLSGEERLSAVKWTKSSSEKNVVYFAIQFHYSTFNYFPNLGL